MASNESKPIGFIRFIIVSSIILNVLRAIFMKTSLFGGRTSMIPFAIALWIFYRYAREQVWWPFATVERSQPLVSKKITAPQIRVTPVSSTPIRPKMANLEAEKVHRMPNKLPRSGGMTHVERTIDVVDAIINRGERPRTERSKMVRSKTVRSKTVRAKVVRSKRQPIVIS